MNCIKCNNDFELKPYNIKAGDFRCQACRRDYQRQWRERRVSQGLPAYGTRVWDKEKQKAYYAKRKANNEIRQRDLENKKKYRLNPEVKRKQAARAFLRTKRLKGEVCNEPCAFCGETESQAHHPDYGQPLLILWLCDKCHRKIHLRDLKHPELYYNGNNKGHKTIKAE